jgi:hypothetical protein
MYVNVETLEALADLVLKVVEVDRELEFGVANVLEVRKEAREAFISLIPRLEIVKLHYFRLLYADK